MIKQRSPLTVSDLENAIDNSIEELELSTGKISIGSGTVSPSPSMAAEVSTEEALSGLREGARENLFPLVEEEKNVDCLK